MEFPVMPILFLLAAVAFAVLIIVILGLLWREVRGALRFYYRLVPYKADDAGSLERLRVELGRRGVYAVNRLSELYVDDIVEWRIRMEDHDGVKYLAAEADVKTWYLIITIILLFITIAGGILLGALAYIRFSEKRDALKGALISITNEPAIAAQL